MRKKGKVFLLATGLVLAAANMASEAQQPTGPGIQIGDGLAMIQAYDSGRQTVTIGKQAVALQPKAALSLEQQLAKHGLSGSAPFSAKFSSVRGVSGQPLIESIYVFPRKKK